MKLNITIGIGILLGILPTAVLSHGLELGTTQNFVDVVQPNPHPVIAMTRVSGNYLGTVGMDFYIGPGNALPDLQSCRIQQVWISESLRGTLSGFGNVFCRANCPNLFDLNVNNAHQHFTFSASAPGIYVWDFRAVNGVSANGQTLDDMPYVYRIYLRAGTPGILQGGVTPASQYVGALYDLMLKVQIRSGGSTVAETQLPVNPRAIQPYMVGFEQTGVFEVVAKLDKHLSRKVNRNLSPTGAMWNIEFPILGDVNGDDHINDSDLLAVLFAFGSSESSADLTGDGIVNDQDLLVVLFNFGMSGDGAV